MRTLLWKVLVVAMATCRVAFPANSDSVSASPSVTALGDTLVVGKQAPDFKLRNQAGVEMSLKEFRGHWIVLYFYPKNFTGGCTLEAHNFQRDSALYLKAGAVILGVSTDDIGSHKDFCSKERLGFNLLADTNGVVSGLYHSIKSWVGVKLSSRNTFIIDPDGNVAKMFTSVKPAKHSEEVLEALAGLKRK